MRTTRSKLILLLIILSLACNGCVTLKLWEATDPNDSIKMNYAEVNEEALKAKGAKYVKDDRTKLYYIEKDSSQKYQDYAFRVLGTPITVALDAGFSLFYLFTVGIMEDAKERGHEAEVTKHGYRSESFPLPRNPFPR